MPAGIGNGLTKRGYAPFIRRTTANKNFLKKVVDIRGGLWYYNNCQEERELATLLTHIKVLLGWRPSFRRTKGTEKL